MFPGVIKVHFWTFRDKICLFKKELDGPNSSDIFEIFGRLRPSTVAMVFLLCLSCYGNTNSDLPKLMKLDKFTLFHKGGKCFAPMSLTILRNNIIDVAESLNQISRCFYYCFFLLICRKVFAETLS